MALDVELVVNGGVDREELLRGPRRSELGPLSSSLASRLMRNFGSIVGVTAAHMPIGQAEIAKRRSVGSEPIGDEGFRWGSSLQEPPHEFQRRFPVALRLDEDIQYFSLVVDCAPEIVDPIADPNEKLVEMPAAGILLPPATSSQGVDPPNLSDHRRIVS